MANMIKTTNISDTESDKETIIMQVSSKSKKKWDSMKNYPDESYEDMFNHFVRIVEEEEEDLTEENLANIERAMKKLSNEETVQYNYPKNVTV